MIKKTVKILLLFGVIFGGSCCFNIIKASAASAHFYSTLQVGERWGEDIGKWNNRTGGFKAHQDDLIRLNHFSDWKNYPIDDWHKSYDNFNLHQARFTTDDRNVYGWVRMQDPNKVGAQGGYVKIQPNDYIIKVNGESFSINLLDPQTGTIFNPWGLNRGKGVYVDVQVVDLNGNNYYTNTIKNGAYVYEGSNGIQEMTFAVPYLALGKYGVKTNQSTKWNFNQPGQLNDGQGITKVGSSTGPYFLVVMAILSIGIGSSGIFFWQRKQRKHELVTL